MVPVVFLQFDAVNLNTRSSDDTSNAVTILCLLGGVKCPAGSRTVTMSVQELVAPGNKAVQSINWRKVSVAQFGFNEFPSRSLLVCFTD